MLYKLTYDINLKQILYTKIYQKQEGQEDPKITHLSFLVVLTVDHQILMHEDYCLLWFSLYKPNINHVTSHGDPLIAI